MSSSIKSLGEFGLINRLRRLLGESNSKKIVIGIGDDAAVLREAGGGYSLMTHDLLLEGIHFLKGDSHHFEFIGWKALAVNLSDIAAMGGTPSSALVGLGLPASVRVSEVEALYRGLKRCAKRFSCPIAGGDTNRSKSGWVIAITVAGRSENKPLLRSGARVGDSLWVTGTLGGAALGWEAQKREDRSARARSFLHRHGQPIPRLEWGRKFLESGTVSSLIDVSDGLAGDLGHLAEASRVGFEVELERLPFLPHYVKLCRTYRIDPVRLAVTGGEDYELLLTVRRGMEKRFFAEMRRRKIPVTYMGRVARGSEIRYYWGGKRVQEKFHGYRHF